MESLFSKCNKNTDTATPYQNCDGTLLPIVLVPNSYRFEMLIWKCSKCGRTISLTEKIE